MEALHFFGLTSDLASEPATPKMFENSCEEIPNLKKRQRHFSLEDCNAMDESEDSNSSSNLSNLSGANNLVCSKRVRQNSIFFSKTFDDSDASSNNSSFASESPNPISDFFASNFLHDPRPSMSLELDNDHLTSQLRSELEVRLLETLCPVPGREVSRSRRKLSFELPPQLLSVIAAHVIQEAANEPYGLKGNFFESLRPRKLAVWKALMSRSDKTLYDD